MPPRKPSPGKPKTVPPRRPASPREPAFARTVVEGIADPMVVYGADWRVRWENAAAVKSFAAAGQGSMLGRNLWTEYPDLIGTEFEHSMRRAMDERVPTTFVERRRGRNVWTEVRCYPLPDGGIAAVWKNITDQKRGEQTMRMLAEVSAILSQTLDHEVACAALAEMLVPDLADTCSIALSEGSSERTIATSHAGKHVAKLGPAITVPLTNRGRQLGTLSLARDEHHPFDDTDVALAELIGRRVAMAVDNALLYREAQLALAEAQTANELKSTFLARISHELRTPLNAIGGYVDLLTMGVRGQLTPEQIADLERVKRSQHHLLSLINDLLNFARLEAGKVQYDIETVAVGDLLRAVEPLFAPQLIAKKLRYVMDAPPASLQVQADIEKTQQILVNLVSNAVKYTKEGGSISVAAAQDGEYVEICVKDTGIGIPKEKLETIFEPFVQLARHPVAQEGTGLGLAISRDLARAMNGELTAASNGSGSVFTLRLPRHPAPK